MSELMMQYDASIGRRLRLGMPFVSPPRVQLVRDRRVATVLVGPVGTPFNFYARSSVANLITVAALQHGLKAEDLVGPSRRRSVTAARKHAVKLAMSHCPWMSLTQLGVVFKRDHTTILYLAGRVKRYRAANSVVTEGPGTSCPCCGAQMSEPPPKEALEAIELGASEREVLSYYLDSYPRPLSTDRVIDRLWQLDPNGGPAGARNGITQRVWQINQRLRPLGWAIEPMGKDARQLMRVEGQLSPLISDAHSTEAA